MAKIVVIEDDKGIRENLKEVLEYEDFEVFTATGGREGLELIKQVLPDLIICDVLMPGITGINVAQEVKLTPSLRHIPILFISAAATPFDIQLGLAVGALVYLTKPYSLTELINAVRKILIS